MRHSSLLPEADPEFYWGISNDTNSIFAKIFLLFSMELRKFMSLCEGFCPRSTNISNKSVTAYPHFNCALLSLNEDERHGV